MIEIDPWNKDIADINGRTVDDGPAFKGLVRTCERMYSTDSSLNIVPKVALNLQEHTSIEYNLLQDLSKQTENPYLTDIAGLGEDAVSKIRISTLTLI